MKKWIKAARGLVLAFQGIKLFDPAYFASKRVAIVGPASSAFNTGKGDFIDNCDIVVRLNKSPVTMKEGKNREDIGVRTDVLLHCFFENPHGGGGPLDFDLYEKLGIQFVINPRNEWSGIRNSYNYYKKYGTPRVTYLFPKPLYRRIAHSVKGHRPTTGYSALYALLESEFSELYVTGFTFFKTAYGAGYRDEMREAHQAQQFISQVGLHNPDAELQGFKKILEKNKDKKIVLDPELQRILEIY